MSHIIIGTAGHIDHGKTALVRALTGFDTDRLKEEKERGLTIDLGFAPYGENASIIDVPGHEKFVRNMVAGVSTIDLVLLVIAADDGIMPQTREHLEILNVLQVRQGIIAISKSDLVEPDWLQLVIEDVRTLVQGTFLSNAKIIPVSTVTQAGIDVLDQALQTLINALPAKSAQGLFWLPVDRAFVMKGFGTVVTGSVLSGGVSVGDTVELLPSLRAVKIRGLQRHGKAVETVGPGDRAAINLQGIEKDQAQRGFVLATPGYFKPTDRIDATLRLLESAPRPLASRSRVRLHVGTSEVMARVATVQQARIEPGTEGFVQLQLEAPVAVRRRDAFVIRQYSPTVTIGGGVILDANAPRHKLSDPSLLKTFQALQQEDPGKVVAEKVRTAGLRLLTEAQLAGELGFSNQELSTFLTELVNAGTLQVVKKRGQTAYLHEQTFQQTADFIMDQVNHFHEKHPTKTGMKKPDLLHRIPGKGDAEAVDYVLDALKRSRELQESAGILSAKNFKVTLSTAQQALKAHISTLLLETGFAPPSEQALLARLEASPDETKQILQLMLEQGEIVRLEDLYFHATKLEEARAYIIRHLKTTRELDIAAFKQMLGNISRKYAMPLLNYFDALALTEREGDVRVRGSAFPTDD